MEDKIIELMMEMTALKSRTGTSDENLASDYIYEYICNLEYFRENPDLCGNAAVAGDSKGRHIPYGLVLGKSDDTVILSGHFDVVSEEDYGEAAGLAFYPGKKLEKALSRNSMTSEQSADMQSGEWIWGRGTADMKGGLAVHMALLEEYSMMAEEGKLEGSILFMAVPDEESYSAGMRSGVSLMASLKDEYGLEYKALINPEPTDMVEGKQVMYLGSAGKMMPVIMVQGIPAHAGHCFDGLNPLSIMNGIYERTNGSLDFVDTFENEASMPPAWLRMRDMKKDYDLSIPARASGYFTVMSLTSTPEKIMKKLEKTAESVCRDEMRKYERIYGMYKRLNKFETKKKLGYAIKVYTFGSLVKKIKKENGSKFDRYYEKLYQEIKEEVDTGTMNYPEATEYLMEELLDYSGIKEPLVLIALAPPYYPSVNSNKVACKEGAAKVIYEEAAKISDELGQPLTYQNFFMGISDNSYTSVPEGAGGDDAAKLMPLWGDIYSVDFMSIQDINVPSVIYGPWGKDYHRWSERVSINSLVQVVPTVTRCIVETSWNM